MIYGDPKSIRRFSKGDNVGTVEAAALANDRRAKRGTGVTCNSDEVAIGVACTRNDGNNGAASGMACSMDNTTTQRKPLD